jgi:hypothetical protein
VIERRSMPFTAEMRAEGDKPPHLSGHAAIFNALSDDLGFYRERILPGAFDEPLARPDDVRLLINHEGLALARTKSGTLKLEQDEIGLKVDADLDPANPRVAELSSVMGRGDVDQMSFAFEVGKDEFETKDGVLVRTVEEVNRLWDGSIVTFPAYTDTDAELRALLGFADLTPADRELRLLRAVPAVHRWASALGELREGKVLSSANARKLRDAVRNLIDVLEAAGVPLEDEDDSSRRLRLRRWLDLYALETEVGRGA